MYDVALTSLPVRRDRVDICRAARLWGTRMSRDNWADGAGQIAPVERGWAAFVCKTTVVCL